MAGTPIPGNDPPAGVIARGQSLGRYIVLDVLGQGGMGVVYAAYDSVLDRKLAIKLLRADRIRPDEASESEGRARLLREAQALARLSHPNVVTVHDVGTFGSGVFLAMEFVQGTTLRQWLSTPRPWSAALEVLVSAGRGLAAAHAVGMIHRDFKPDNVMVGVDGRVLVTDFGIARAADPEAAPAPGREVATTVDAAGEAHDGTTGVTPFSGPLTVTGAILGTLGYVAPEQAHGRPIDARADQFSYCVTLYYALFGVKPFPAGDIAEYVQALGRGPRAPPQGTRVPAWVSRVVLKGLEPRAEDRHASMDALLDALGHDPDATRRARWRVAGVGAAATALLLFAAAGWGQAAFRNPCAHPEQSLAGVWDEGVKARVRAAFAGTGRPYAEATTTRVLALLDRHASAHTAMRAEICEASRAKKQRPEILDLRDACLARRRSQLEALTALFADRPDVQVLDKAVPAAAALYPVATCADTDALTARVRPPEDPALRARVAALEPRVDRIETLFATGKYKEGLALGEPLLAEAAQVPYPPLRARARFWTGRLKEATGDYEAAKTLQRDAAVSAAEGGDDVLAADALARLLFVVGERQRRFDEGSMIRSIGAVVVARAHDARIEGLWANAEGLLLWRAGKLADAKATFERALALREEVLGPDDPEVAATLSNLGLVLGDMGDYARAVATHERVLAVRERALGPDHPAVAATLNNLGIALQTAGDGPGSLAAFERSLALREKVLGPDHPDVAQALNNLAGVLANRGDYTRAAAVYERSLAIGEKALGPDHTEVATVLGNLGSALYHLGDYTRAKASYERALAIDEKALGAGHVNLAYALEGLGRTQVARGELKAAQASLERARSLREEALGPSHPLLAATLLGLGELSLARHKPQEAAALLERALALAGAEDKAEVLRALAEALWQIGEDRPGARALAEQARAIYERAGHRPGLAGTTRWLAEHRAR